MMVEGPSSKSLNVLAPNTTTSSYITTTTTTTTFYKNTHFLDYTIEKCFTHLISVTMCVFMLIYNNRENTEKGSPGKS